MTNTNTHTCSNQFPPSFSEAPMYPAHSMNKTSVDEWLSDAPMPYDSRFSGFPLSPSSSTDHQKEWSPDNAPPFDATGREPFSPVSHNDDDNIHSAQDTPPGPTTSTPPAPTSVKASDIATLERLTLNASPERPIVEVLASDEEDGAVLREMSVPGEVRPWCTVYYYELAQRVGNPFTPSDVVFTIDGATGGHSSEHRMSLSARPPAKNSKSGAVRNQIGSGLQIRRENGVVWLKILSDQVVFVQCPFRNQVMNEHPSTILRLQNASNKTDENGEPMEEDKILIKLFDSDRFKYERMAAERLPAEDALNMMQAFCTTRVSFIKGYGPDYSRHHITDAPCWIEIHLTEPYEAFDEFFRQQNACDIGSRS